MEPNDWMVGGLAATTLMFLILWLKAQGKARLLQAKIAEAERMDDMLDEFREHTMLAAKSAALEAGQTLSSKLLEDHKRENEAARELHGKTTKQITQSLTEQVQKISNRLESLHDQHGKQSDTLSTIWKSLTTPIGAGKINEIGLENLLKSFGLEPDKDFKTQFTIQGEKSETLRPDVTIFMPYGRVMVIDAKASQYITEIAKATDDNAEQLAQEQLKTTMNKHLRDLATKDYRAAVKSHFKAERGEDVATIWSVMYVPSEAAIEQIHAADPSFADKLLKADIVLASRGTLHGLLSLARLSVENERQVENSVHIVEGARSLLDGVTNAFGHVDNLGKSISKSMEHFNKFAGSANQSILGKAKKLEPYGITPSRGKQLPESLTKYQVAKSQESDVVELELVETQ